MEKTEDLFLLKNTKWVLSDKISFKKLLWG